MRILILFALFLIGCSSKKDPPSPPPIPVTTTCPIVKAASFSVTSLGTLLPNVQAKIFPKAEGSIVSVCVHEGQDVEKGARLFIIDSRLQTIAVEKGKAEVREKEAECRAFQSKLLRYRSLSKKDLISKSEMERLEAEVEKAKESLKVAQLQVQEAELAKEWCTITAPITGRVGKIDCAEGIFVTKETLLTTITQLDPLIVECTLTEKEVSLARSSTNILVSPLASPDMERGGTITFFDNTFEEKRGVLLVRGVVPNGEATPRLAPGQVVVVHIPYRVDPSALLIPQEVICYNQEGPYVYAVKEGGKAEICQLTLGDEVGDERIVLAGLTPDANIVVGGISRLFPGCAVITFSSQEASA